MRIMQNVCCNGGASSPAVLQNIRLCNGTAFNHLTDLLVDCTSFQALVNQVNNLAANEIYVVSGTIINPNTANPQLVLTLSNGAQVTIDVSTLEDAPSAATILALLTGLATGPDELISYTPTTRVYLGNDGQWHRLVLDPCVQPVAVAGASPPSAQDGVAGNTIGVAYAAGLPFGTAVSATITNPSTCKQMILNVFVKGVDFNLNDAAPQFAPGRILVRNEVNINGSGWAVQDPSWDDAQFGLYGNPNNAANARYAIRLNWCGRTGHYTFTLAPGASIQIDVRKVLIWNPDVAGTVFSLSGATVLQSGAPQIHWIGLAI